MNLPKKHSEFVRHVGRNQPNMRDFQNSDFMGIKTDYLHFQTSFIHSWRLDKPTWPQVHFLFLTAENIRESNLGCR